MIKIVAELSVKQDRVDEFIGVAKELVEKSSAEAGNISYSINKSKQDDNVYAFIEVWRDREAVDIHNASEHFNTLFPKIQDLCAEAGSIKLFEEI